MEIIYYLLFGGIVGWIASMIMGTDPQQGILGNIIVGIVGAFLGSIIMNALGQSGAVGISLYGFIVALIGAVVLLWIFRAFASRRTI